ncbi:AEC family transporter [Ectobacillus sp. sgz5001026]|uniref:AEC family transporter n=1 Tax=Ectobacillus sp. sgz5001026 TaxID=3242473 RepID=UPI0036D37C64
MALFEIILPVFLIFFSGYWAQKRFQLDIRTVSVISLYILSPALIFRTFYMNKLDHQFFYIVLVQLLLLAALILITRMVCRWLHYDSLSENALILTTAFMNSGNYGTPIILFAFGDKGFNDAVIIMILHALIMGIFGVYYASRGKSSMKEAILNIFRIPNIYAVGLGLVFQYAHISITPSIMQAIDLVGQSSIPVVMLVLGMQLAMIRFQDFDKRLITMGTTIRLLVSPVLAWGIVSILPIDPLLKHVIIVLAAMPSAVTTLLYSVQYDARPQLVSAITFVSTVLSFITISILVSLFV